MNCLPFEEKIAQYVDGGLDPNDTRDIEDHLRTCPACAEFAEALQSDRTWLRTVPPETADVDFAALRRQIRSAIVHERRAKSLMPVLLLAASVLLAVAVAAIWLAPNRGGQQPRTAQLKVSSQTPEVETMQAKAPAPLLTERRPHKPRKEQSLSRARLRTTEPTPTPAGPPARPGP